MTAGVLEKVRRATAYTTGESTSGIRLDRNESPYDFPSALKREVARVIGTMPWNLYPDVTAAELRSTLADFWRLDADQIVAGNGSNELLAAVVACFVEPGVKVVVPRPAFGLYEQLVELWGGEIIHVAVDPRHHLVDVDAIAAAVECNDASVVIISAPGNPAGGLLPPDGVDRLLATGAVVILDRAYGEFIDEPLPAAHERLVVLSTFSKAWGLAAVRIGWLFSTADVASQIRKTVLPYCVDALSARIAILALKQAGYRDEAVLAITAERKRLESFLRDCGQFELFPAHANFVTFRCLEMSAEFVRHALAAKGIHVRDVSSHPALSECLRVTVGTPEQNDSFLLMIRELAGGV